jgi:hypothetical protein
MEGRRGGTGGGGMLPCTDAKSCRGPAEAATPAWPCTPYSAARGDTGSHDCCACVCVCGATDTDEGGADSAAAPGQSDLPPAAAAAPPPYENTPGVDADGGADVALLAAAAAATEDGPNSSVVKYGVGAADDEGGGGGNGTAALTAGGAAAAAVATGARASSGAEVPAARERPLGDGIAAVSNGHDDRPRMELMVRYCSPTPAAHDDDDDDDSAIPCNARDAHSGNTGSETGCAPNTRSRRHQPVYTPARRTAARASSGRPCRTAHATHITRLCREGTHGRACAQGGRRRGTCGQDRRARLTVGAVASAAGLCTATDGPAMPKGIDTNDVGGPRNAVAVGGAGPPIDAAPARFEGDTARQCGAETEPPGLDERHTAATPQVEGAQGMQTGSAPSNAGH